MLTAVFVIVLLLAFNALYVAAEFAFVGVRRTKIDQLAAEGKPLAKQVQPIIADSRSLDLVITASQIGITITSLILGAYGNWTVGKHLAHALSGTGLLERHAAESLASVITLLTLISLQVIFAELLPKAIAMRYASSVAMATVIPMRWSLALMSWLIWIFTGIANLQLKALGLPATARKHVHQADEIDLLVAESHEGGMLEDAERQRLHNVFVFAGKRVRDVMIPRTKVFSVNIETPVDELLRLATSSPYTRVPVYEDSIDTVLGAFHVKDLLASSVRDGASLDIRKIIRPMPRLLESMMIRGLLSDMRAKRIQMSLVVDEYGGTAGIVTLEDLLEEVIGDIPDEYEKHLPVEAVQLADGRIRIPASMSISDANAMLGTDINYANANTIGGLVMGVLGRMPESGDRILTSGCELEVESLADHVVEWVILDPTPDSGESSDG